MVEDDEFVGTLMRTAGRRTMPPESLHESAFAAASAVLERKLRTRRRRQQVMRLAAMVLVAVGSAILVLEVARDPASGDSIARIDRAIGTVEMRVSMDRATERLDIGAQLAEGTVLATSAGSRVGLLLNDGTSLRLAPDTQVELRSPAEIRLIVGKIYVDTGVDARRTASLRVLTAFGVTRDLGTRFEVRCSDRLYRLRVREGVVVLDRDATELRSAAGEELTVDAQGEVGRATIAPDAPDWQWATDVAPQPDLDGAPLSEFLDWVARETGRKVRYATPEVGDRVRITLLHGHVAGLAPLEALSVMLATTDFEHSVDEDGTIVISPRKTAPRRP